MIVIPAIDLKNGQCVRLRQGRMEDDTVFSNDPIAVARQWLEAGARRLHLVDLNGAFAGKPVNGEVIARIIEACADIPVQLGGGIRDEHTVERYLELGLQYCIIGTKAVQEPEFVSRLCKQFPGHIIVGLDAKDGMLAVDGWAKVSQVKAIDLAARFENDGVQAIVYTDISRDGMMNGVNVEATVNLTRAVNIPVIASGGITNINDIKALCEVAAHGVAGAITGRAIYEGTLDFSEAQRVADELSGN